MRFRDQLTATMPAHFTMPDEFLTLADWIERKKYVTSWTDPDSGEKGANGSLVPPDIHHGYNISHVYLEGLDNASMNWVGSDRLYPLGGTGADGSYFHLWIDDNGIQQVVHTGSGSGSMLFATFPSALSVLRLFAVGYPEPCMQDDWCDPPELQYDFDDDEIKFANSKLKPYRRWLRRRWGQETPRTGVEALGLTSAEAEVWTGSDGPENDPFRRWLDEVQQ